MGKANANITQDSYRQVDFLNERPVFCAQAIIRDSFFECSFGKQSLLTQCTFETRRSFDNQALKRGNTCINFLLSCLHDVEVKDKERPARDHLVVLVVSHEVRGDCCSTVADTEPDMPHCTKDSSQPVVEELRHFKQNVYH